MHQLDLREGRRLASCAGPDRRCADPLCRAHGLLARGMDADRQRAEKRLFDGDPGEGEAAREGVERVGDVGRRPRIEERPPGDTAASPELGDVLAPDDPQLVLRRRHRTKLFLGGRRDREPSLPVDLLIGSDSRCGELFREEPRAPRACERSGEPNRGGTRRRVRSLERRSSPAHTGRA
jgi:hypothetical protein